MESVSVRKRGEGRTPQSVNPKFVKKNAPKTVFLRKKMAIFAQNLSTYVRKGGKGGYPPNPQTFSGLKNNLQTGGEGVPPLRTDSVKKVFGTLP